MTSAYVKETFTKEIDGHLGNILNIMRDWVGRMNLEVEFGRIMIVDPNIGRSSSGDLTRSHLAKVTHLYLSDSTIQGRFIYMTNMITVLEADAQYLVDLNSEQGGRYWSSGSEGSPQPECLVTYEFICEDRKTSIEFLIEVNAETFEFSIRTLPSQLGVIYSHCLLRNWDYRIVATGSKELNLIYGDLARMLVDSLYIP